MTRPDIGPGTLCLPDCDVRTAVAALLTAGILTTVKTLEWTADADGPKFGLLPKALDAAADAGAYAADALLARLARAGEITAPGREGERG